MDDIADGREPVRIPITVSDPAKLVDLRESFTYTPSLRLPDGLDEVDLQNPESGCSCLGECTNSDCECVENTGYFYDRDGLMQLHALPPKLALYECSEACSCTPSCRNRLVQSGLRTRLNIQWTAEKGLGLFAKQPIKASSFLCLYAGEVISKNEARKRWAYQRSTGQSNYILAIKEHLSTFEGTLQTLQTIVDPRYIGNIGRFINHACPPKATHIMLPIRKTGGVVPMPALFAVRDIEPGEELTWDYQDAGGETWFYGRSESLTSTPGQLPCKCGSLTCRGFIPYDPSL